MVARRADAAYVVADSIFLKPAGAPPRFLVTGTSLTGCRCSPDGTRLVCAAGNAYLLMVGALFGNLAGRRQPRAGPAVRRSGAEPYRPYRALGRGRLFVLLQESESDVWVVETEGM